MATAGAADEMDWKIAATELQQTFYNILGDREWDVIEKGDETSLLRKVGYGVYGKPLTEPAKSNEFTGYDSPQLELIDAICKQLNKKSERNNQEDIYLACIYVTIKTPNDRFTLPVFRMRKAADESAVYFVDTNGRVYSSWRDYLKNNTLPQCLYCYPREGYYTADTDGKVLVDFGTSPASKTFNKIVSASDTVATVVTFGAVAVGVAALASIPIAGPIMAGATVAGVTSGLYAAGRGTTHLVDRSMHEENIGLFNMESAGCWLSIVGGALGVVQGPLIKSMTSAMTKSARSGEVMGKMSRIAFSAVNAGCLTVDGLGIAYGLAVVVDKLDNNELTPLDVFQFTASCLFFKNAAINLKSASTIIKEAQRACIGEQRAGLTPAAKKLFNKHTGQLRGPDEMHGNAGVIRAFKHMNNVEELYELMAHPDGNCKKVKLYPDGLKGLLDVNKQFKVHPNKFLEIPPETRKQIFDAIRQLNKDPTKLVEFRINMAKVCKEHRIVFEHTRKETQDNLCKAFGKDHVKDIVINSKRLFLDMKPFEIDRLSVVFANAGKNFNPEMLELVVKFCTSRGCKTVSDFCSFMEYTSYYVREMKIKYENDYNVKLMEAKKLPGFKEQSFNDTYGIKGKRNAFFEQKASTSLLEDGNPAFKEMTEHFESWKDAVSRANRQIDPRFESDNAATYHYLKHQDFGPTGNLSVDQYFKIVSELVNDPRNQTNSMLSQEGDCTFVTFKNPVNGAFGVRIDRVQDGEVVSGIATVFYNKDYDTDKGK